MDGDRHNPRAVPTMMIALIVMFTTLRPILIPPTVLVSASNPKPGMTTEAEFRVKQLATKSFWAFSNSAFAFALAAALVQVGKRAAAHGSGEVGERVSFMLVMVALLFMSLSTKCVIVVRLWPSSLLSALSLIDGLLLLLIVG